MKTSESTALRPEIAASWQRVEMTGLRPDAPIDRLAVSDVETETPLTVAATPVLDELMAELADTGLCLALADRNARIIDLRYTDERVAQALQQISAVPGSRYTEDVSGTNSVATPFETRHGITVNGTEHYLDRLKQFSCYGHPIRHPVTRRIEGVLDITGMMPRADPLFGPFVRRAVADIERRLLDGSSRQQQYLLAAFQSAAQQRSRPVVVLGGEVVLTNPAAVDLLEPADHAQLRALVPDLPFGRTVVERFTLASGQEVRAEVGRIDGTNGLLILLLPGDRARGVGRPAGAADPGSAVERALLALRDTREPVLILGEPGTGRSTAVRTVAGTEPIRTLDAARLPATGERAWARQLDDAVARPGVVAVEEIQLLPPGLCVRLGQLVAEDTPARLVLTGPPREQLTGGAAGLAARCVSGVELPPLRHRRAELPRMVRTLLVELAPDRALRCLPTTLAVLAAQQWPGNLRELAMVIRHAASSRSAGDLTLADLPPSHRTALASRVLTPWEQAEHDAITDALRATGGNKLQAAERLGISRSTLYNRIRALRISTDPHRQG